MLSIIIIFFFTDCNSLNITRKANNNKKIRYTISKKRENKFSSSYIYGKINARNSIYKIYYVFLNNY